METVVTLPTDDSWYVLVLAFCQNIVREAVPFTFAIFALHKERVLPYMIAAGMYFGMTYLLVPMSCALANWYSFRFLSVVGPIISLFSMLSSHFVIAEGYNYLLILTFSVFGGFGCSMLHVTAKLMPSYWFCNRRGLAHTFAYSGQALGYLIIPNCCHVLFHHAFKKELEMIFFFFAGLYVPLSVLGWFTPNAYGIFIQYRSESRGNLEENNKSAKVKEAKVTFRDEVHAEIVSTSHQVLANRSSFRIFRAHHNLVHPRVKDIIRRRDMTIYISRSSFFLVLGKPWTHGCTHWDKRSHRSLDASIVRYDGGQTVRIVYKKGEPQATIGSRPMYRTDIFYPWNVFDLPVYYRQDHQLDFHLAVTRAMTTADLQQEMDFRWYRCIWPEAMMRTLLTMLSHKIYQDHYIFALMFATFFMAFGSFIPLAFIERRGREAGMSSPFMTVTYAGFGMMIGRLVAAILALITSGAKFHLINVGLYMFGGFVTGFTGYLDVSPVISAYAIIYGVIHGLALTLRFSAVYETAKLNDLTNAMGHAMIWQAVGFSTSGGLSGFLIEHQDLRSRHVFAMSGSSMFLAGVLLVVGKALKDRRNRSLVISV